MGRTFLGGEKIKVIDGEYKGLYGYARFESIYGFVLVILDNGLKVNIYKDELEIVKNNYFAIKWEFHRKVICMNEVKTEIINGDLKVYNVPVIIEDDEIETIPSHVMLKLTQIFNYMIKNNIKEYDFEKLNKK